MESAQFIYNGRTRNFFNTLVENLQQCTEFKISVAFITYGGLQVLLETLEELSKRNIPGEILTTTYQNMTTPAVLKRLSEFPNIKLKIYVPPTTTDGFHAKGYLFHKSFTGSDQWTVIIGSSNITGRALKTNVEWNVLQNESTGQAQEPGIFAKSVLDEFELLWKSPWAQEYSDDFLISYRDYLARIKKNLRQQKSTELFAYEHRQAIQPNAMQQEAIVKLDRLRKNGASKALAIAATGSGKTYMSVFDALQFKPKRLLFIVHREDILKKAKESFDTVCGAVGKDYYSGFYTGNQKDKDCSYLFATRDTMSRHYEEFSPDDFDYIVIDEAHHASSESYQKIISYFKPDFLLGLTATPERSDNGDIYSLFDNNVAVEIRLRQALEYNLICPFHYFGLTDAEGIDYSKIKAEPGTSEYTEEIAKMLMVGHRVDYIIEKMKFYGHDSEKPKVLGFCQTIKHAKYMAKEFCERGISAVALSSEDNKSIDERIAFTKRLEDDNDELKVIFTVDLFNEGIDIPSVNTILMLRPTESSIIFIQQLGRGLRKIADKEFVTVLDFIGNYNKSFLMAIALNGKQNFDKDSLKLEVETDFADLPNGTYIHMDKIAKEQILRQLENEKFMSMKYMKESYFAFKHVCGGKIPMLIDYLKHDGSVDPLRFSSFSPNYKTYLEFVSSMEKETHPELSLLLQNETFKQLLRLFTFYTPAKRIEEWLIADSLLKSEKNKVSLEDLSKHAEKFLDNVKNDSIRHSAETLSGKYFDSSELKRYESALLLFDGSSVSFKSEIFSLLKSDKNARLWFEDLIQYNLLRYQDEFGSSDYGFPFLKLYYEYSMRDLALLCNYKKTHSAFRGEGLLGLVKPDYLIFVNLHKDADIDEAINYKDKFISPGVFQWQSPNDTTQTSEIGQDIIHSYKRGKILHLFVRKFKKVEGVTQPFVYLGKVVPFSDSAEGNKPITIQFALENRVPDDMYLDFTTRTDMLGKDTMETPA